MRNFQYKLNSTVIFLLVAVTLFASADSTVRTHRVEPGETLYRIAQNYEVTVDLLQHANGIIDPTRISTGQQLSIPRTHTIQKGDTIYSIGRHYNIVPAVILAANEIMDPTQVRVGQILHIPESVSQIRTELTTSTSIKKQNNTSSNVNRLWPVTGAQSPLTGKLSGLRISGTEGDAVRSVSSGTVRWASPSRGFGRVILIENPLGYIFGYLGNSETFVHVGDSVEIGTEIGRLGINPHDQAANLYFLVFKDGLPTDPWQAPRV